MVWWPPHVQRCLLASFGVDYKFLARLLAGSPATSEPGGVVVVDNHQGHEEGSDSASYAPWEVATPPFFDATYPYPYPYPYP